MEKKIDIKKNGYVLFFVNIGILLTLLLFRTYYISVGYHVILVNAMLGINIFILLVGIFFNVLIIKRKDYYDEKKSIKLIIVCFIVYILINTLGVYLINKPLDNGYTKISETLSSYCDSFECDKYETIKSGLYEEFVIKKQYFDYDNVQNNIEIYTKYNSKQVVSVKAIIYSENDLFSENLIKEQLASFYDNFNYEISSPKIKEAFDKRFDGKVFDDNATYKVDEIYSEGQLHKLKTTITLEIK